MLARALRGSVGWASVVAAFAMPIATAAAFSAYTYAAAVTAGHFLTNVAAYALAFAVQVAGAVLAGTVILRRPLRGTLHAFALTYLPLELFFLFLLGAFVVAPEPYAALVDLARWYVLPSLFGIALVWSVALTYCAFRAMAGGRRLPAALCTALHYAFFLGVVGLYTWVMDLLPLPRGS